VLDAAVNAMPFWMVRWASAPMISDPDLPLVSPEQTRPRLRRLDGWVSSPSALLERLLSALGR
jgi:hypothetical protein